MIALDTNVLIRFLVADDRAQAERARNLITANPVYISPTVLLESEWVLRAAYGFAAPDIGRYFRAFLGLANVTVGEPHAVATALDGYDFGMDFADALHVALAGPATRFASFDKALIKKAKGRTVVPVIAP